MRFNECEECLSVIKKLHTAHDGRSKVIWYKPKTVKMINISKSDGEHIFETDKVSLLSLSPQGVLVQYEMGGVKSMNPFPLNEIKAIEVE